MAGPKKQASPKAPIQATAENNRWQIAIVLCALVILTALSFSPAVKNGLTNWDDNAYVFNNAQLPRPLSESVPYFFGLHYFIGNYIPITMIVYALEYHAAAIDPSFYHTVNIFIHIVNVLLTFWFIYLLSNKRWGVAAFVALFFAIHPMHVESVVWVAELKDMLYSAFFLWGLIVYIKYLDADTGDTAGNSSLKKLGLVFLLFMLSVLSKPAALVFPIVLLLIDFYRGRKQGAKLWIEKIPFFIVSVVFGIIAVKAQQADHLIHEYYPLGERLLFAAHSLLRYAVKLFIPGGLSIYYPYPQMENGHLPYLFYAAPVVLAAALYGVYRSLKHTRLIAFGVLFFITGLLLVLQVLSIGDAIMAERYTYIPYIGLLFIIGMGAAEMYDRNSDKLKSYKQAVAGAVIIAALACSALTYARCKVWENDITIAEDLLEKYPDDRLALNNMGFILFNQQRIQEAIQLLNKAIERKPDYTMAHINLINCYIALKDFNTAIAATDKALGHDPKNFNLLNTRGYLLQATQHYTEAIPYYKKAIENKPENATSYIYLGECYFYLKDYNTAFAIIDEGLKYEPQNYVLLNHRGFFCFTLGKYDEAIGYYKAALASNPNYTLASANLENCYKVMKGQQAQTQGTPN